MSTGTALIEEAYAKIAVNSVASAVDAEGILYGMNALHSMMQLWESEDIILGVKPLVVPGDDLEEPPDARNAIIDNLAIQTAPFYDNGKVIVSKELKDNAGEGKRLVRNIYWDPDLPKKVVSGNLPLGQGYQRWGRFTEIFHGKGSTING